MSKLDLRRALKERGFTIVQVAQKMGVVSQTVQQFIKGNPTVEKLYLIADAIGCDVVDLFYPTAEDLAVKAQENADTKSIGTPQPSAAPASADTSSSNNAPQVHFCPHCGTKFQILE